jgi:hypothetical protein
VRCLATFLSACFGRSFLSSSCTPAFSSTHTPTHVRCHTRTKNWQPYELRTCNHLFSGMHVFACICTRDISDTRTEVSIATTSGRYWHVDRMHQSDAGDSSSSLRRCYVPHTFQPSGVPALTQLLMTQIMHLQAVIFKHRHAI